MKNKRVRLLILLLVMGLILITAQVTAANDTKEKDAEQPTEVLYAEDVVSFSGDAPGLSENFYQTFRDDALTEGIDHSKPSDRIVYKVKKKDLNEKLLSEGLSEKEIEKEIANQLGPEPIGGLPVSGRVKVPVFLVDFSDYPHYSDQTNAEVWSGFNSAGYASQYPYNSVDNYYRRSSYGELNFDADVYGWYRAAHPRSYYTATLGTPYGDENEILIREIMTAYSWVDFTRYDNDNDGDIDAFFIKWTGPNNGWANQWWAYQWTYGAGGSSPFTVDGKTLGAYVWSWYGGWGTSADHHYYPRTDIHETGHLLGLPDYYDYTPTTDPKGGVGGWDMMDGNTGDHNAFSKWLLGWGNNPGAVFSPENRGYRTFSATTTPYYKLFIMPTKWGIFGEYFLVEYRKAGNGNDPVGFGPGDGFMIWHVDATLSGANFMYNNSDGAHKLLRLMEADGLEEIDGQTTGWKYDIHDFYTVGKSFTQNTKPNSNSYYGYDGASGYLGTDYTGVSITSITHPTSTTMKAYFNIVQPLSIVTSWTASGTDLDSHLKTPTIINTGTPATLDYHIYYGIKGNLKAMPTFKLHMDEMSGGIWWKPEVMQGRFWEFPGYYTFYVQSYSGSLSSSGAKVRVYKNGAWYKTYYVPTSGTGNIWRVFDLSGYSGNVITKNYITSVIPPSPEFSDEEKVPTSDMSEVYLSGPTKP